jgi:hypothetical protein
MDPQLYLDEMLAGKLNPSTTLLQAIERELSDAVSSDLILDYSAIELTAVKSATEEMHVIKTAENENLACHMLFVSNYRHLVFCLEFYLSSFCSSPAS